MGGKSTHKNSDRAERNETKSVFSSIFHQIIQSLNKREIGILWGSTLFFVCSVQCAVCSVQLGIELYYMMSASQLEISGDFAPYGFVFRLFQHTTPS